MSAEVSGMKPGLYRTLFPHPTMGEQIPGGRLVYFSPTSDQGIPVVLVPEGRNGRVWSFGSKGAAADDASWASSLVPLEPQGYYLLKRSVMFAPGQSLPEGLLVFLGYSSQGEPVLFPGVAVADQNIAFSTDGVRIGDVQVDALQALNFTLAQHRPAPTNEAAEG